MKLTLTFEGSLPASGNKPKPDDVWRIRKDFHPQLAEFHQVHPVLRQFARNGLWIPKNENVPFFFGERHHSYPDVDINKVGRPNPKEHWNLCEPIIKGNKPFLPLVRESLALICGVKVLFLRKEAPGSLILQGGDVDNRVKTLFDALSAPPHDENVLDDPTAEYPMYCLCQSDALITSVEVKTDRLLTKPNSPVDQVHLVVEVDVRVVQVQTYNMAFNGD
jgi:hypothetical protein